MLGVDSGNGNHISCTLHGRTGWGGGLGVRQLHRDQLGLLELAQKADGGSGAQLGDRTGVQCMNRGLQRPLSLPLLFFWFSRNCC